MSILTRRLIVVGPHVGEPSWVRHIATDNGTLVADVRAGPKSPELARRLVKGYNASGFGPLDLLHQRWR